MRAYVLSLPVAGRLLVNIIQIQMEMILIILRSSPRVFTAITERSFLMGRLRIFGRLGKIMILSVQNICHFIIIPMKGVMELLVETTGSPSVA